MLGGRCRYVFSALIGKMKRMSTHPPRCRGSDRAYASPARARQLNLREAIDLLFGHIDRPRIPTRAGPFRCRSHPALSPLRTQKSAR